MYRDLKIKLQSNYKLYGIKLCHAQSAFFTSLHLKTSNIISKHESMLANSIIYDSLAIFCGDRNGRKTQSLIWVSVKYDSYKDYILSQTQDQYR